MATNKTTNYLISIQADLSGAKKIVAAQKLIESTVKQTGRSIGKVSEVLKVNTTVVQQKNGPAYLKLDAIYKTAKGNIERLNAKLDLNGKILKGVGSNASVTTTHINKMGASTVGLIGRLGNLAKRAFAVIVVWQGLRTIFQTVARTLSDAIKFLVDFEAALADIRIATGDTVENTRALGTEILDVAKKFGIGFETAAEAATLLAQQGKNSTEIIETLGPAMAFSTASSRSLKDIIEDLTAVQKAYNLTSKDTEKITDAIQKVQASYIISTADLSAGLRRVGPVAAAVGVTLEETIGIITAIQSSTFRSGETVGNSIRTIFARLQGDRLQAIQSLAQIPTFLDEEGKATFKVTATNRSLIPVLNELAQKWKLLGETQKIELATRVAGERQIVPFIALLDQWDTVLGATKDALNSQGASAEASAKKLDTLKGKIEQLSASWSSLLDAVSNAPIGQVIGGQVKFDVDFIKKSFDTITRLTSKNRKDLKNLKKDEEERAKKSTEYANLQKKLDEKKVKVEENRKTILEAVGKREREILDNNASDLQVVIEKRKLLLKLAEKAGFVQNGSITDETIDATDKKLQKQKALLDRKNELNREDLNNEATLKRLESLGFNDLEIQIRKIDYERQKADEIAKTNKLAADYTKVEEEQIRLQEILNQKITEQSNKLKGLLEGGFKDFLLGNNDNIIGNFTSGIREAFAGSTATGLADLVSKTGISDLFGQLNTGLAGAFSGVGAGPFKGITQAHVAAMPFVTQAIVNAHKNGAVAGSSDDKKSGIGGFFGSFKNPGILGGLASAGLGALGGISGGPFGSTVGNSIFGATQGLATAVNPVLGTAVGVLGGLFSLFRKPKRTVDIKEENRSFQIASKIEVTNNKLDVVNRNLVAIKGALETFILPDSAFFSTKRNLEDQFALNTRRGLG